MQEDPYVMVGSAELEGYCIDLLKALASMLHFSYKVKVVGDGKYGANSSNGNWTGMIGEILRQVTFISCLRSCSINRKGAQELCLRGYWPCRYQSTQPGKHSVLMIKDFRQVG